MTRLFLATATLALTFSAVSASAEYCLNANPADPNPIAKETVKRFRANMQAANTPLQFTVKLKTQVNTFQPSDELGLGARDPLIKTLTGISEPEFMMNKMYRISVCRRTPSIRETFAALLTEMSAQHIAASCRFFNDGELLPASAAAARLKQSSDSLAIDLTCYYTSLPSASEQKPVAAPTAAEKLTFASPYCVNSDLGNQTMIAKNTVAKFKANPKAPASATQFTVKLDPKTNTFKTSDELGAGPRGVLMDQLVHSLNLQYTISNQMYFESICGRIISVRQMFAALLTEMSAQHIESSCRFAAESAVIPAAQAAARLQASGDESAIDMTCYHAGVQ